MEKKTLIFSSGIKIQVEVASTSEEKAKGLMYRKHLPENSGMLFIFPIEQKLSFWMKNTYVPLTIGFFDSKMKLLETQDMQPHLGPVPDEKLPHYESEREAKYALEMEQGWFVKNKIKPGITFRFSR
ncbi:MAG: DUF192 domain-containing protein [Bdellovibrionaceae bacterium]|nr:DUF192 domain-containing protein [Pseudobdellovibrionaceae bacterium]